MDLLFYAIINMFCIALLGLLTLRMLSAIDKQLSQRLLIYVFISNMVGPLCECIYAWVDGQPWPFAGPLNLIANSVYFASTGIAAFFWILYCMAIIGRPLRFGEWRFWLAATPMLLLNLLVLISLKTHILFYIDEQNRYHRGPLHILQVVLCFICLAAAAIISLREALHRPNMAERPQLYTQAFYVLLPFIGGAGQVLMFGVPLLNIGLTFGFVMVYLQAQDQQISRDQLTGINNRTELYRQLYGRITRFVPGELVYLAILDVDKFKVINDKFGHVEGDRALRIISDALRIEFGGKKTVLARYGGDEFVVLAYGLTLDDFTALCRDLNPLLEKLTTEAGLAYHITVSYGIAQYNEAVGNQQSLLRLADSELYKVKAARPS